MDAESSQSAVSTTSGGAPVRGNQKSITTSPRGTLLMQGDPIIKKLAHH